MVTAFWKVCVAGAIGLVASGVAIAPANAQQALLSTSGELSSSDERLRADNSPFDVHVFQGSAGQLIQVSMESSDFDTYVFLLDDTGAVLDQNDDFDVESSTNSQIQIELPRDGEYQVVANSYDSSGRGLYTLTVSALMDAAALPEQATDDLGRDRCQQALDQVKSRLTDGRSISVPYQTELAAYGDFPEGRPTIYSVSIQGNDSQAVLNSPELLRAIGSEFVSDCNTAAALSVALYQTGQRVMFGVVGNQSQLFRCAEDIGLDTGPDGLDQPVPWGYYYCTL